MLFIFDHCEKLYSVDVNGAVKILNIFNKIIIETFNGELRIS